MNVLGLFATTQRFCRISARIGVALSSTSRRSAGKRSPSVRDFGGRSLDFSNDTALGGYSALVESVLDVRGPTMANGSGPERIAEIICSAATDDTDRLRYEAGDAVRMLAARRATDDGGFLAGMKAQFGLGGQQ